MKRILCGFLGVALLSAGCADPAAPVTPTPVAPTISETFSDTLLVAGSNLHIFTVTAVGGVKVKLTSLDPSATVGLGIGFPSLGTCSLMQRVNATASDSVQISGTATFPGQLCVQIFDIVGPDGLATLTAPVAYTINVLHS